MMDWWGLEPEGGHTLQGPPWGRGTISPQLVQRVTPVLNHAPQETHWSGRGEVNDARVATCITVGSEAPSGVRNIANNILLNF